MSMTAITTTRKTTCAKCLKVVLAQLFEEGVPQDLLQPLIDLQAELANKPKEAAAHKGRERRRGTGPSETLVGARLRRDRSSRQGRL